MSKPSSIAVGSVGLGLVAASSIPACFAVYKKIRPRKGNANHDPKVFYEDGDGVATETSQTEFSTILQRSLFLASSIVGFLLSLAISVLHTQESSGALVVECWLTFGAWVLLVVQAFNLFFIHNHVERYQLGLLGAGASLFIIVVLCIESGISRSRIYNDDSPKIHISLTAIQLGAAVVSFLSLFFLPRRPHVFFKGRPVDAQLTTSAFGRYTFAWGGPILAFARNNRGLSLDQLPLIAQYTRSEFLQSRFNNLSKKDRLYKMMFSNFKWAFLQQFILTVLSSIIQFGPQYTMYQLLKLLEAREEGASVATIAWVWVVGLGLTMVVQSFIDSWLFFIIWSDLGIPIRSLLSILVFMKSTRKKDVKGVQKAKNRIEEEPTAGAEPAVNESVAVRGDNTVPGADKRNKDDDDDEEDSLQKSRQSTVNLVGVDAKRISDFSSYAYIFPGAATKMIVSLCFLYTLIGWKSLLAGLVTFALSTPVNIFVSRRYNAAQGDLMKFRDQKMSVVTECLNGIRQIKFSALERQWQDKIGEKRRQELKTQWRVFRYDVCLIAIWIMGPVMLSAVSLTVYAILTGELSASIAFTTLAILGQIEGTLAIIPELTTDAVDAWVSIKRIEEYLNAPEKVDCTTPSDGISFEGASIAWPSDSQEDDPDRFVLRDVNLRFPNKELSVISGKTGSGKSLLLASILGEVDKLAGTIKVPKGPSMVDRFDHKATKGNWIVDGSVAFVAQIPWIENATIKDNILFGLPCDTGRYKKVLSVCALEKDLDMLPDGELTDIGANGINLSGGQRWRISFARALYSRAGILVLDDIFSAVDAHVGRHLFEEALTGELGAGRTRILVTHHVQLCLSRTKYSVLLGEGTVAHAGFVADLQRSGSLADFLKLEDDSEKQDESSMIEDEEPNGDMLQKVLSRITETSVRIDDGAIDTKGKGQPKKFTEDEKREQGSIKLAVYKEYVVTSGGFKVWTPLACFFVGYMVLVLGRSWWVSLWTRSYETESTSFFVQQSNIQLIQLRHRVQDIQIQNNPDLWYYLGIYIALSFAIVIIGTIRYFTTYVASIRASRIMFEKLSYTVLRTPLRWLDTVPVGRVLNRFTADFNILDSRIAGNMGFAFYQCLELVGISLAGFLVSPYMIIFAALLMCIALYVALRFLYGAREVKRLESNAKSPVFEQFGSALAGVGTIRAFDKAEEYIERMYKKIDNHALALWHIWLFNRWMGFRLNVVGAVFAILVAAVIVSTKSIDASLAGFALAFALQYTGAIIWTLRAYSNLEMDMNATERIIEYTGLETEVQGGEKPPAAWPTEGNLEVDGVVAGYAPDLPPVLKGLSFSVAKKQRVGVVGRTGAGKSSLTLTLFRFLEAREGSIHIDGIDISKINLHDLRSRLAIIPQDPVLFSGTVRSNLDAFDEHTDAELRDALERVHLVRGTGNASRDERVEASSPSETVIPTSLDTNTNIFNSLASQISEGGLNLSQGQRQLLCLARAIVSRPKIMVLDEATSAVDMATDVLIQRSIREEFGDSTLLVIAHRLSTIADFDRILVMSDGKAMEYDSPKNLLEQEGAFWEMVGQSGEKEKLEEIILGVGEGSSGGGSSHGGTS